jgi:hypothetical protein
MFRALLAHPQEALHKLTLGILRAYVMRLRAPDQGSTVGGLLSVSPPEEHNERRTFCRRGGNPRTCNGGSAIDS